MECSVISAGFISKTLSLFCCFRVDRIVLLQDAISALTSFRLISGYHQRYRSPHVTIAPDDRTRYRSVPPERLFTASAIDVRARVTEHGSIGVDDIIVRCAALNQPTALATIVELGQAAC